MAADELFVTPGAISQLLKSLEAHLGVKLFKRVTRGIFLTDAGRDYLPAVRNAFSQISELLETPRMEPFIDKWSEAQNASAMGLDPDAAVQVKAALDGSEVASRLQGRMGTDADRPDEPPSMRDQIEAAVSYQQNRGE